VPLETVTERQIATIWCHFLGAVGVTQGFLTFSPEIELKIGEIHVWRAKLDLEESQLRKYEATLSPDELSRASRFNFVADRNRFVAGRGILRMLLGRYLKRDPFGLEFEYSVAGKPSLRNRSIPIDFNLSHSNGLAVFAFAFSCLLGVDIESVRDDFASEEIAARFFSSQEVIQLKSLPPEAKTKAFFQCWTRKEAYVKAHGDGLKIPLDSFGVSIGPGSEARFMEGVDVNWHLLDISESSIVPAALVYQAEEGMLNHRLNCHLYRYEND
jgi:4'-phosphopantetheinyl transferase